MIDMNRSRDAHAYLVTVGFHSVTVNGADREDAIAAARRALCRQLPRLYDVIRNLQSDRFQVSPVSLP